ncbi:SGNH/GDSL hydrolase family protein [Paracoccus caeni]|uniref:SGNH/GDSL hydrolase family protein n=1 Tax=Paracoccus caeni TaxID=657651 RepID=A0A934W0B0_9RHOB|nr:SGNH/GDSL hydrolase family protein [Paracoccus caeni]MBK4216138.1 SGNH/GDSL hydrolase family protein [Paracoccus caeni]
MAMPVYSLPVANGQATKQSHDSEMNRVIAEILARSAKAFFSRNSAAEFGQANLPTQLGLITTIEGDWIASRAPGLFADDPLFAPDDPDSPTNGPWWGVRARVPTSQLFERVLPEAEPENGGMVPLIAAGERVLMWVDEDGNVAGHGLAAGTVDVEGTEPSYVPILAAGEQVFMWLHDGEVMFPGKAAPDPAQDAAFTYSDNNNLHRWRTAISKVELGEPGAKAKIALIGDSWIEQAPIPRALYNLLAKDYEMAGGGFRSGVQHFEFVPGVTWTATGWDQTDGSNQSVFPYGAGPDGNSTWTTGTTAAIQYLDFEATDIQIVYRHHGGSFRYSIDGGAYVEVVCNNSQSRAVINISGLADGPHSLRLDVTNNTGGGTVVIDYIYTTRAPVAGVQVLKLGNGGTAGFWVKNYTQYLTTPLAEMQPDVVVVVLGTNDYRSANSPPSVYVEALQQIVDACHLAVPDIGFVFVVPSESQGPAVTPLADYRDALWNWAIPRGHQVISLLDRWPGFPTANAAGLWRDQSHVSDPLGATMIAKTLVELSLKG